MDKSRGLSSTPGSQPPLPPGKKKLTQENGSASKVPPSHTLQNGAEKCPGDRHLSSFSLSKAPARIHLKTFILNQLAFIRDAIIRLTPKRLKTFIHELRSLTKTRSFGQRLPSGIPDNELKHYVNPKIVVVRGFELNHMHHALVVFNDPTKENARFLQINDAHNYPEIMNRDQFIDYLTQEGGKVMAVYEPSDGGEGGVPDLQGMHAYLKEISAQKWRWEPLNHNCMTLGIRVLEKAGCDVSQLNGIAHMPRINVSRAKTSQRADREQELSKGIDKLDEKHGWRKLSLDDKKNLISSPEPKEPPTRQD